MSDDPAHIFNLLSVLRVVSGSDHNYSVSVLNEPLGYNVDQIDAIFELLEPTLRTLVLAGYKPNYIELSNSTVSDSSRLFYDLEDRRISYIPDEEDNPLWTSGNADIICHITCEMYYTAHEEVIESGSEFLPYGLPLAATGTNWSFQGPDSSADSFAEFLGQNNYSLTLSVPSAGDDHAVAISTVSEPFIADIVQALVPFWGQDMPQVYTGLLWIFDSDTWFSDDFDHQRHSRLVKKVGKKALLDANADEGEINTFLNLSLIHI